MTQSSIATDRYHICPVNRHVLWYKVMLMIQIPGAAGSASIFLLIQTNMQQGQIALGVVH